MDCTVTTVMGEIHSFAKVERPFAEANGALILKRRQPGGEWESAAIYAPGQWVCVVDKKEDYLLDG